MEIKKNKKKSDNHYVDNKKFYIAIVDYHKELRKAKREGREAPRIPEYIGKCIFKIAEKLSYKPCFINYTFRDEMISDGIENSLLYFHDYDPKKGQNPFAYFTQIIYYAFLRRINKEERNRYTTYKNFQHTIIHDSNFIDCFDDEEKSLITKNLYDNINEFMDRFEKKEEIKKNKRREAKGLSRFINE